MLTDKQKEQLRGLSGFENESQVDPTYFDFSERTGAPYVRGVAEVSVDIDEQNYKIISQHKARGHSMYNKNHPTYRQSRFDMQGADIYTSNHNHRKQVSQEAMRVFGGAKMITHIASGAYVSGGEYGDRSGFAKLKPKEMYGASIRIHKNSHKVDIKYDILDAHREWA